MLIDYQNNLFYKEHFRLENNEQRYIFVIRNHQVENQDLNGKWDVEGFWNKLANNVDA